MATAELGLASTAVADNSGGGFDVFSSLRDGTVGEDFSSGIDDIGEEVNISTDEAAGKLDLVAVAGGEEELPSTEKVSASIGQTACVTCVGCPFLSQCIKPQALAVKQESENQENISADMSSASEEAVPNLMEMTPKQSYLERLLAPDDFDSLDESGRGELVMAGYSVSTDHREPIIKKAPEPAAAAAKFIDLTTKTDGSTGKITLQEREGKTSTSEPAEALGDDVDAEVAEALFFGLKTAPEIAADDTKDVGESRPESANEISGEGHFTETLEVSSPSIEVKPHVIDSISDADDDNKQSTPESLDTPAQAETAPASLAINEGKQTGGENSNPLENETAYPVVGKDNVTASVVENTYDGNAAAVSDIKPSSIEHPKENDVVITTSKSSNPEPRQAAEGSFTPIFEQRLAAQFDATEMDELAAESIDGSNVKPLQNTQPREAELGMAAGYDDSIQTLDGANNEQPGNLMPDVDDVLLPQERTVAASVPAEYDKNETYQSSGSYSIGQSGGAPQAILSQEQMLVESSEDSLTINDYANFDSNLVQPKTDDTETDVFVANDVVNTTVNTTDKTDVAVSIEMIDITPNLPDKHTAVDRNGTQLAVDLPQELGDELVVDTDASEPQIPVFRQLDCYDTTMDISRSEDRIWAEEEVFFVKQDLPGVESELTLTEVAAVISPAEVVTVCEEPGDLKLSVGNDIDSVGQLDNSKAVSVPEITNDYEPVEQIAIPVSPAIELIPDVELDEPAVEISEERIMPREERDNIVMKASEKSDLPRLDDEVEAIITDTSDVEPVIDLPEAQEELVAIEISEAVESELDEQNDLAIASAVDSYSYNSGTSAVSDNVLVVKGRLSSGLWPDDSRLNPEEESASTAQSSADDASLVSRLVGMFVVAICVVRGRQSVKV